MKELENITSNYHSPDKIHWRGRLTSPELGIQYWYQAIQLLNVLETDLNQLDAAVGLLGYACDEGVRRNLGRLGAVQGPEQIKSRLAKFSYHLNETNIIDFGNVVCSDSNLETCQYTLAIVVEQLLTNNIFPIILGGGHDVAYGHFKGIWNSFQSGPKPKIGIINFDAHFDLRPLEKEANSGTPFFQIFNEFHPHVDYFVIGIQRASNTKQLFEIANQFNVKYLECLDCQSVHLPTVLGQLDHFVQRVDHVYITIDLDGFSSAFAPGVSAPSPIGLTPHFVMQVLKFLIGTQKVISCDIAEMNPRFDQDHRTAKLAARLVEWILRCKSSNEVFFYYSNC